jgi:hypothetical protein
MILCLVHICLIVWRLFFIIVHGCTWHPIGTRSGRGVAVSNAKGDVNVNS